MRSMSQTTITILRDEITDYRRGARLSRETVAASIVDAHENLGADVTTGIRFEPKTVDAFERTKVNADRIFRWLDDATKDGVLLPANFLVSVLAGLPEDVRRRALDRILLPLGFAARSLGDGRGVSAVSASMVATLIREQSEAAAATTNLLGTADRAALLDARREMAEAVDVGQNLLAHLDAQISEGQAA
ncbi:Bacterial toxin YdaT domain-containing protein [Castellaniella denitrificans]